MGPSIQVQHLSLQNRAFLIVFGLAFVTFFFGVWLVVHAVYWSEHCNAGLAEWMTIGHVAQSDCLA